MASPLTWQGLDVPEDPVDVSPPASEVELIQRADALAGRTLGELAAIRHLPAPADLRRNKGWIGELLEYLLGAEAGNKSEPDFPALGIELKSIPVNASGKPRESTWVCTAPVGELNPSHWRGSVLQRRLARVLWLPILGEGAPGSRRVGAPVIWSPDADQEATLAADYETLTELLAEGQVWQWHARHGTALQLRPKAASSKHRKWVLDEDAEWVQTVPLGFYLRARFTAAVLAGESRLIDP